MDYLRRIGFIFQGQGLIGCNGLCLGPSVFNIVFIKNNPVLHIGLLIGVNTTFLDLETAFRTMA